MLSRVGSVACRRTRGMRMSDSSCSDRSSLVLGAVGTEAPKVENVAEEEPDEGGRAEDIGGEKAGGQRRLGLHELGDLGVHLGKVECRDGANKQGGDCQLGALGVVKVERPLEVDGVELVGQPEEVRVDAVEGPARLPRGLEHAFGAGGFGAEVGLPGAAILDGAGRAEDLVHPEARVAEGEQQRRLVVPRRQHHEDGADGGSRRAGDRALAVGAHVGNERRLDGSGDADRGQRCAGPFELEPHGHGLSEQHHGDVGRQGSVPERRVWRGALHRPKEKARDWELARLEC
mmetsp:Transcript_1916/g.6313  ORF Transcript_1916/g.6313 Transcript_1916/m.6313 type:complete len:289 (+) Transcript_1916:1762-2628(+)